MANTNWKAEQAAEDFIESAVPLDRRYGIVTMALLWVTMMTNFPMVLFGFEWYHSGFSLAQVLLGGAIAGAILVAFQLYSGFMGANSGLNYVLLLRSVFGSAGSKIVSLIWCLLFLGWYSLNAVLFTDAIKGLMGLTVTTWWVAVPVVVLMAFNNWFGFRGVANFARYLAAPVLILWVMYSLFKTLSVTPVSVAFQPGTQSFSASLVVIPVLVVGNAMWGNEADFFRFGKPSKLYTWIPLVVSVVFGEVLFPATGWLLGRVSGAADAGAFVKFMNDYSFGSVSALAALVLVVSYFALNDGNLYGSINALEDLWKARRHHLVSALVVVGALLAIVLSWYSNALDMMATFNAVLLPCATLVIMFEYYFAHKVALRKRGAEFLRSVSNKFPLVSEKPSRFAWTALTALFAGWVVAIATSGTIPQLKWLNNGVWILYAWASSFFLYGIIRSVSLLRRTDTVTEFITEPDEPSDRAIFSQND